MTNLLTPYKSELSTLINSDDQVIAAKKLSNPKWNTGRARECKNCDSNIASVNHLKQLLDDLTKKSKITEDNYTLLNKMYTEQKNSNNILADKCILVEESNKQKQKENDILNLKLDELEKMLSHNLKYIQAIDEYSESLVKLINIKDALLKNTRS